MFHDVHQDSGYKARLKERLFPSVDDESLKQQLNSAKIGKSGRSFSQSEISTIVASIGSHMSQLEKVFRDCDRLTVHGIDFAVVLITIHCFPISPCSQMP